MFSQIAIPTQQLQSFVGPAHALQSRVKCPSSLRFIDGAPLDMIDGQESPIILTTAHAHAAVSNHHFLAHLRDGCVLVQRALIKAFLTSAKCVLGGQRLAAGLTAPLFSACQSALPVRGIDSNTAWRAAQEFRIAFATACETKTLCAVTINQFAMRANPTFSFLFGSHVPIVSETT